MGEEESAMQIIPVSPVVAHTGKIKINRQVVAILATDRKSAHAEILTTVTVDGVEVSHKRTVLGVWAWDTSKPFASLANPFGMGFIAPSAVNWQGGDEPTHLVAAPNRQPSAWLNPNKAQRDIPPTRKPQPTPAPSSGGIRLNLTLDGKPLSYREAKIPSKGYANPDLNSIAELGITLPIALTPSNLKWMSVIQITQPGEFKRQVIMRTVGVILWGHVNQYNNGEVAKYTPGVDVANTAANGLQANRFTLFMGKGFEHVQINP
jgi:hypothetical protein